VHLPRAEEEAGEAQECREGGLHHRMVANGAGLRTEVK
jgi:hypothetical protein